jgi:Mce-associated membrane protein
MSDPAAESAAPTRTPTWVWIVIAVLGAAVVFTTTFALIQRGQADDLRHKESLRRTAASTAAQFAGALYTYDYSDLAAAKARVLQFATAAYAKGYAASSPAQQETIAKLKAKESAKVTGVFLSDVVGNRVAGVVILNTTLQSSAGNRASTSYLDVALVRQGSTWKVDTAKPVPIA